MDALIDQHAAALIAPCAPPGGRVVVELGPERGLRQHRSVEVAQRTLIDHRAHAHHLGPEPVLEHHAQRQPSLPSGPNHLVGLGWGRRDRLFSEDVLARLERLKRDGVMQRMRHS